MRIRPRIFAARRLGIALAAAFALAGTSAVRAATPAPGLPSAPPAVFEAPAAALPAGPYDQNPYDRVLPSGRFLRPSGKSVVTGMNALGVALSPDARYAVVSNDDEREPAAVSALDPQATGGYSLAVVDLATMTVVSRYRDPAARYYAGVAAVRDPARPGATLVLASGGAGDVVYAFDLSVAGVLTPDAQHPSIALPLPADPLVVYGKTFPGPIVAGFDGTHAYVVGSLASDVVSIDLRTRKFEGRPDVVGYFPYGIASAPGGIFVANEGLTAYRALPAPLGVPNITNTAIDAEHASSLSIIASAADGTLAAAPLANLAMDPHPDGLRVVGGAHPSAVVAMRTKPVAFVAMTNVDRIATVSYGGGPPRVVGGTELRLFDRGPYGTQPTSLALSPDEKRLYVTLAGIDAVAVLDATDPTHLHRLGLIPTGWDPTALALSADGRFLYVANTKGIGEDASFVGFGGEVTNAAGRVLGVANDANTLWSTLEKIDLKAINLRVTTPITLANQRTAHLPERSPVVPQYFGRPASAVTHVVEIVEENKTYDAMLGDLTDGAGRPYGPGDPALVSFDTAVTPNLHALARTYGLAGNFYADAENSAGGHQVALGGISTPYTERTSLAQGGRGPLVSASQDPEDYPRAGYVFNSLAARSRTFRDYGDFLRIAGYDDGLAPDARADDPTFVNVADETAATTGLGGLYGLDGPALGILASHLDPSYPGFNLRIRDVRRASEFVRDFDVLAKANEMPAYTLVSLPDDRGGTGKDIPNVAEEVADGDRALGKIVDYLTHLPQFGTTAIFIEPADAATTRDHIDAHRTYAIVISPYVKHHYLGMRHLSTASVLKTQEELLGLPALSLGDALASDMRDFFTPEADLTPYSQIVAPTQTAIGR